MVRMDYENYDDEVGQALGKEGHCYLDHPPRHSGRQFRWRTRRAFFMFCNTTGWLISKLLNSCTGSANE